MKRITSMLIALFIMACLSAETIRFSGANSSLSLREGQEEVTLSDGAYVTVGSLSINSDSIVLSGSGWRYVECSGTTVVRDEERGLEIRTTHLWFDRTEERLLISPWFELEDKKEELNATGGSLNYDMKKDSLELSMLVSIMKTSSRGLLRCRAENVLFSREEQSLLLRGGASVSWAGDNYQAEAITISLEDDSISLDGRIRGNING